jgi:subtilisin family serine protease
MVHDGLNWRIVTRRAALILLAAISPFAPHAPEAHAQSIMRTPSLHIDSRVPSISPTVAPRINPTIAGRDGGGIGTVTIARTPPPVPTTVLRMDRPVGVGSSTPYLRYSHNLYPVCEYANRGPDGECFDRPVTSGSGGTSAVAAKKGGGSSNNSSQAANNLRTVQNEFVAEIDGAMSPADADALARSHGLERIASQNFPLVGGTIGLFRIIDRRPVDTVRRELAADAKVKSVQPNFRYVLQDQKKIPTEGDPAQYAVAQLRLPQAHTLARGMNVTIAVIDSGIDLKHPELANSVADSFDALGSKEGPHVHGTGIAGAIVAHGRLMGSAPEARLLAIRAFSGASGGAQSTSYVILKALDYAAEHGAQIVNMSFAGPKDPMIERGIAATAARGILLVAAAGNGGAKSPPLYPAANPNVIAVSGTDAQERLFTASNRGNYIAIAAPGADIFLPAPDEKYQMTSGTSFSAAYVSGIAALVMERNPALNLNDIRAILTRTARDLGAPGRDDLFGAGEADAFAAVTAAVDGPSVPVASAIAKPAGEKAPASDNASVSRALTEPLNDSAPALSSDNSAANDANRATAR